MKNVVYVLGKNDNKDLLYKSVYKVVSDLKCGDKCFITAVVLNDVKPVGLSMGYVTESGEIRSSFSLEMSIMGTNWCDSSSVLGGININTISEIDMGVLVEKVGNAFKLSNDEEVKFLLQLLIESNSISL